MYTGSLWLSFENENEEAKISAKISSCVMRGEEEIAIDFAGIDDGEKFSGNCKLHRQGECFVGTGNFRYEGKTNVLAEISVKLEKNGSDVSLYGTWRDEDDREPYDLEIELQEFKPEKH